MSTKAAILCRRQQVTFQAILRSKAAQAIGLSAEQLIGLKYKSKERKMVATFLRDTTAITLEHQLLDLESEE